MYNSPLKGPGDGREVIKVHFNDDSYKSFFVGEDTSCRELCSMFEEKMHLPSKAARHFAVHVFLDGKESRRLGRDDVPVVVQRELIQRGIKWGDEHNKNRFVYQLSEEATRRMTVKLGITQGGEGKEQQREALKDYLSSPDKDKSKEKVKRKVSLGSIRKLLPGGSTTSGPPPRSRDNVVIGNPVLIAHNDTSSLMKEFDPTARMGPKPVQPQPVGTSQSSPQLQSHQTEVPQPATTKKPHPPAAPKETSPKPVRAAGHGTPAPAPAPVSASQSTSSPSLSATSSSSSSSKGESKVKLHTKDLPDVISSFQPPDDVEDAQPSISVIVGDGDGLETDDLDEFDDIMNVLQQLATS